MKKGKEANDASNGRPEALSFRFPGLGSHGGEIEDSFSPKFLTDFPSKREEVCQHSAHTGNRDFSLEVLAGIQGSSQALATMRNVDHCVGPSAKERACGRSCPNPEYEDVTFISHLGLKVPSSPSPRGLGQGERKNRGQEAWVQQ